MKKLNYFLFALVAITFSTPVFGQEWYDMMRDRSKNFYEIQDAFNKAWEGKEYEKGKGWKQFKRWEYFWERRVDENGNFPTPAQYMNSWEQLQKMPAAVADGARGAGSGWTEFGPSQLTNGLGRINVIEVDPNDANTIYIGTPAGGVWKTTNAGSSWTPLTDFLPTIGSSGIAVNPQNSNTIFITTGDFDNNDAYGTGIWVSYDAGSTWQQSSLTYNPQQFWQGGKIAFHPTDSSTLIACADNGLWRTTNSGANWTQVLGGDVQDFEFKPGDPSIVYAVNSGFHRSTNGGASWFAGAGGLPGAGFATRLQVAVTPANPNVVYVLGAGNATVTYKSTNNGANFTAMHNGGTGNPLSTQIWYDLGFEVSPTNENDLYSGGVQTFRSTNSGANWGNIQNSGMHVDIHWLRFEGSWLYCGNDGGIYRSSNQGGTWINLSPGLQITQYYRFSNAGINNIDLVTAGSQDNGTHKGDNGNYSRIFGGDGMDNEINTSNPNMLYLSWQNGNFYRSNNGGNSAVPIFTGLAGTGAWVTPVRIDPNFPSQVVYVGYNELYRSTTTGNTYSAISNFNGGNLDYIQVAKANSDYIYVSDGSTIRRTTNGGTSWTTINGGLPAGFVSSIAIHPTNPLEVWVSKSSWTANNQVYHSTNGGTSWTNLSNGLPTFPANIVMYQEGSPWNGLYVGTDIGVFYRDDQTGGWQTYQQDLPNVQVSDMEIVEGTNILRISTFGRGIWENDVVRPIAFTPQAGFIADQLEACPDVPIKFTDVSINSTAVVEWQFPGGSPATSTATSPTVTYPATGFYDVTLVVTNGSVNDTMTQTAFINITETLDTLDVIEGFNAGSFPVTWVIENPDAQDDWETTSQFGGYGVNTGCITMQTYFAPGGGEKDYFRTPTIDFSNAPSPELSFDLAYAFNNTDADSLVLYYSTDCGYTLNELWRDGGNSMKTHTSQSPFVPQPTHWKTERVSLQPLVAAGECQIFFENVSYSGNSIYIDNINISSITSVAQSLEGLIRIFPNPNTGQFTVQSDIAVEGLEVWDLVGKKVYQRNEPVAAGVQVRVAPQGLSEGVYLVKVITEQGVKTEKIVVQ